MAPGVAPAARQAAAWPNSCQPADSDGEGEDREQQAGRVERLPGRRRQALARHSTHQQVAAKASSTGTTTHGRNSQANGAVIRRVTAGSETTTFSFRPSSGVGLLRPAQRRRRRRSSPSGASFSSSRKRTSSAVTALPQPPAQLLRRAGRGRAAPSTQLEQLVQQRRDLQVWPSPRRTRPGASA